MQSRGIDPTLFGYNSIQLDGGIERVTGKVVAYFEAQAEALAAAADEATAAAASVVTRVPLPLTSLRVGLLTTDSLFPQEVALLGAALVRAFAAGGGSVVFPSTSVLLRTGALSEELKEANPTLSPTLAFGQKAGGGGGVHIMDMPSVRDWSETVTGLAAAGVHAVIALSTPPRKGHAKVTNGHPIVPVLHIGLRSDLSVPVDGGWAATTDAILSASEGASPSETADAWAGEILRELAKVASGAIKPKASAVPFFNITRGPMGVST